MNHSDFVNTSLRLRYEAFSAFATQVNQASELEGIGEAVAAHLKFVLDAFVFRLAVSSKDRVHTLELFRGQYQVKSAPDFTAFERRYLDKGLPLTLSAQEIQQEELLKQTRFDHPKVTHLMVLPFNATGPRPLVLSISSKSKDPYTELDFRFARLIEELLSTKISQLLLIRKIASKNLALLHANQQLSRLNREVQALNSGLEHKVAERTSRLQEAHQELNTLLYRTSHDFRRPLTSILGLAQLLTLSDSPTETEELVQHLRNTVGGLDDMLIKLQTLMLTEGAPPPMAVDFSKIADEIHNKFAEDIERHHIDFTRQIEPPAVYLSHPSVHRAIIENLIENAIRYHQHEHPFVRLRIETKDKALIIEVADNGEGIPANLQDTIFDMYAKASSRTQGNGLGLFVVKKLTTALGGTVAFDSTLEKGSTFIVSLPLEQATPPHIHLPSSEGAESSSISKSSEVPYATSLLK